MQTSDLTSRYEEYAELLSKLIVAQTNLLDKTIFALTLLLEQGDDHSEQIKTSLLMLHSIGVSCRSISKLMEGLDMPIKDGFMLARSVFETAVNSCFILLKDASVAQTAQRHALQKTYRDLKREIEINGRAIGWKYKLPDPKLFPELDEALQEFTRNGREVTQWTQVSLDDRVKFIESHKNGVKFSFSTARFVVYRNSSELLHGTYFGAQYFWSMGVGRAKSRDQAKWIFLNHAINVFTATFSPLHAVNEIVAKMFSIEPIARKNLELLKLTEELVEQMSNEVSPL
jgi:hypothetical protein